MLDTGDTLADVDQCSEGNSTEGAGNNAAKPPSAQPSREKIFAGSYRGTRALRGVPPMFKVGRSL